MLHYKTIVYDQRLPALATRDPLELHFVFAVPTHTHSMETDSCMELHLMQTCIYEKNIVILLAAVEDIYLYLIIIKMAEIDVSNRNVVRSSLVCVYVI